MSSFRNIIARRRPAGDSAPAKPESVRDAAQERALMEQLLGEISPPGITRLVDQPKVQPEVPKWEVEAPRPTMGSELMRRRMTEALPEADEPEDAYLLTPEAQIDEDARPDPEAEDDWLTEDDPAPQPAPESRAPSKRIWDIETLDAPEGERETAPELAAPAPAPAPTARGGRVRTRLLGFHDEPAAPDVFAAAERVPAAQGLLCPVGWLVVTDGPGRGKSFALGQGLSTIGRGSDQTVALDFGDDTISRDNHAAIAYDEEENSILIGHGGKSNLVRLNGKPLVSTTQLASGDCIRVGQTTLRFVALCGPDFQWTGGDESDA